MPSNVTLGFDFNSQPAQSSLSAFSKALANALSGVETNVAKMREQLGKIVPPDVANNITAIKTAVEGIKGLVISEDSARGLTTIAAAVAKMDKLTGNGVQSLKELRDTLEHMPTDVTKISAGITGVVDAFGGLESVRADSVKAMASVMAATAKLAEQQRSVSPALSAMRQSLNSLFRDITRAQVPTEKLESIASFTRSMRGIATENAGINITSSFAAISNSILNLQASLQNFTITDEQANSLVAVAKLAKAMSNFDTAAASNATLLGEALNSITASTANINIDLSQVNTIVQLAKAIRNIPADADAKGQAIATMFSALANAAPAVSNLSHAASQLSLLGTAIRKIPSGNAAVNNIAQLFNVLEGLEARFRNLNLVEISGQFAQLGQSLRAVKVSKANANNLEKVINILANFRPLSPEALSSIRTLTDLLAALGHASTESREAVEREAVSLKHLSNEIRGGTMVLGAFNSILSTQFLKQSVVDAAAFGRELAYINTIAKEFRDADLGSSFLNMASYLGNARSLANSFYYAYSSGVRGTQEEMMAFTESMAMTSQLIRADVTPTINAVTGMMNAYGMSVNEADRVSRMLFNTIKYGKALGSELAGSLGMVTPTAAIAKIPIEELGAALASLTRVMPTANAITALNNLITKIIRPTSDAAKMAKIYGVELSLAALQSDGLLGTLRKLHDALGDNQDAIAKIFPDIRGIRAAFTLLGNGFDEFEGFTRQFQQDTKSVEDASEQLKNDINYQLGAIPDTIARIRAEAGGMLISILEPATPLIRAFNEMGEFWRKSVSLLALVGAGWTALKVGMMAVQVLQKRAEQLAANEHQAAQQKIRDTQGITSSIHQRIAAEASLSARQVNLLNAASAGRKLNANEFQELYLGDTASSGKGMSMVASLSARKKELAQMAEAQAMSNVALKQEAIAMGDTARATLYATEAKRQWQRYLVLAANAEKLEVANNKLLQRQRVIEQKQLQMVNATLRERLKLQGQIIGLSAANLGQGALIAGIDKVKTGFSALLAAAGAFLKSLMSMAIWTAALWAIGEACKAIWKWMRKADEAAKALVEKMRKAAEERAKLAQAERDAANADKSIVENLLKFNGVELDEGQFAEFRLIIDDLTKTYGDFGVVFSLVNDKFFIAEEGIKKLQNAIDTRSMKSLVDEINEYADSANKIIQMFTGQQTGIGRNALSWQDFQKGISNNLGNLKAYTEEFERQHNADIEYYKELMYMKNQNLPLDDEQEAKLKDLEKETKRYFQTQKLLADASGIEAKAMYDAYIEFYEKWLAKNNELRAANAKRLLEENSATLELIKLREKEQEMRREFTESLMTRPEQARYLEAQIGELERRAEAAQESLRKAREGGDSNSINRAMNEEQKITNAIYERRVKLFNIQREMAKEQFQTQKQAYENTVKMVMEMDKFKAHTANTFEVGTWEAVELMSRRFENLGALPEIKMPEDNTVNLATNPQLAKLIDINTAIAAGLKGAGGKYFGRKLWVGEDFETDYIRNRNLSGKSPDNSAMSREAVGGVLQRLITELTKEVSNMETVGKQMQAIQPEVQKIFSTPDADQFCTEVAKRIGAEIERRGVKFIVKPVGR